MKSDLTHIDNSSTAVQMLVKLMEDLTQLLNVFLIGLQKHSLKVDWQSIPIDKRTILLIIINIHQNMMH